MKRRDSPNLGAGTKSKKHRVNARPVCGICEGSMPFPARIRECGHLFHEGCILSSCEKFFSTPPRCPICNTEFRYIRCEFRDHVTSIKCHPGPRFSVERVWKDV